MTNPTNPFSWQMPTATDLVTDLPADFEVFGQAVATSMADLLGGTTGQVLSKASNTNMDFTWVTSDDANAIQNAIVDAKGDLIAASAADTPARLAVGNNGETLVADSSTSTGLRYNPTQAAGKNYAINGAFDIWQRGTSQTYTGATASGFIADRWCSYTTNSGTASRDTTLIQTDSQYALRWTSSTASGGNIFLQSIETSNSVPLAGKTVTLTVWVAGTSGKSPSIELGYSTTTDLGPVNAFTGITATSGTTTVTSSGTYQKLSAVYAVPSTAKTIRISLVTGTLNNTEYLNFSQCQLELGSVATAFTRTGGTIQGELAACQRYYNRLGNTIGNSAQRLGVGPGANSTVASVTFYLPVNLRTATTSVDFSGLQLYQGTATYAVTAVAINAQSSQNPNANLTVASGLTGGQFYEALTTTTAGYIAFNAEL